MCISCSLSGMNPLEWIQFHTSPSKMDHPRLGIHTPYSLYSSERQATTAFPIGSTFKPNIIFPSQSREVHYGNLEVKCFGLSCPISLFHICTLFLCSTACSHSVFTFTYSIKSSFSTGFFLIRFPLTHKTYCLSLMSHSTWLRLRLLATVFKSTSLPVLFHNFPWAAYSWSATYSLLLHQK